MKCLCLIAVSLFFFVGLSSSDNEIEGYLFYLADSLENYHLIPKIERRVRIDGAIEKEEWAGSLVLSLDYEVEPGENVEPPVRTVVYLFYDEKNLYSAILAYDSDQSKIRARITERDGAWSDDWVGLILDTYNDERRTYDFFSNPLGVQMDQIESSYAGSQMSWDAIWNSAGMITDSGYVVEIAIPFRALNFHRTEGARIWGLDVVRSYPRSVRHHIGLFPRDRNINSYMSQADKLVGFIGVKPGRNIEIIPTFVTMLSQERENGDFRNTSERYDPGLTVHWGFMSNMKLSATFNPDFSQIEADAAELNVNPQYAIYYPEKRPFFLEGSDLFAFNIPVVRFRSFADPEWGIKITGKEGRNSLGFLIVKDSLTNFTIPNSFYSFTRSFEKENIGAVLRYVREMGVSANLGLVLTNREGEGYYNRVGGVNGSFNFARNERINFAAAYSRTKYPEELAGNYGQPDTVFDGWSALGGYYHNSRNINWWWNFYLMDPFFRGDLGHVYQDNYKNTNMGMNYTWRGSPGKWFRSITAGYSYTYEENFGDTLVYKEHGISLNYNGAKMSNVSVDFFKGEKGFLGEAFSNDRVYMYCQIRPSGMLFLSLSTRYGDEIDYSNIRQGSCLRLEPYLELSLGKRISIELSHEYEEMTIEEGKLYTADVTNFTGKFHFNHRCFVRGIIQYLDCEFSQDLYPYPVSRKREMMFSQFLFSYKINPQTVLYLGYSDNYEGDEENPCAQRNRTIFAKAGYSFVI